MLRQLELSAIAINGDECWYFPANINRLLYKNLKTGELRDCGIVPWESEIASLLYRGIEYVNGKVYLIPYAARSIAEYDVEKGIFSKIELDGNFIQGKKYLFHACFSYNNKVFAFGVHVHKILVINTTDGSIKYIDKWVENTEKILYKPKGILSRKQIAYHNNKAFLPLFYGDALLSFDYVKESVELIRRNSNVSGYIGACCWEDNIWLVAKDGTIFCVDDKQLKKELIFAHKKEDEIVDEYIVKNADGVKVYTSDSAKVSMGESVPQIVAGKYDCVASNPLYNAFWSYDTCKVIICNGETVESLELPVEMNDSVLGQIYSNGILLNEKKGFGLEEYIMDICRWNNE